MKKYLLTSSLLAGAVLAANATLVVEETFDYTPVPAGTGGSGTAGSAANLLTSAGYTTNLGNYTISDGAGDITDVSPFAASNVNTLRIGSGNTATKSQAFAKETIYYFSYLFEVAAGVDAQIRIGGTGDQNFEVGTTTSLAFGVGSNTTTGSATQTTLTAGETYFVLGSFDIAADNRWTINANLYTDASSVPSSIGDVTWDHTYTQNFGDKGTNDEYRFQASGGNAYFNGLRIGDDFGSVAVPEPSSYALISGFLALGWIMIRRRK